jgi:multimeric flavodoxin WrbA
MKILVLNGSPQGKKGNGARFLKFYVKSASLEIVHLAEKKNFAPVFKKLLQADAVLFMTGTYWDSWGSPLQKFLEELTPYEGHADLLGKPAACLVFMHSVGGKSVLSRLQGVLNTLGFLLPPMAGMVYSLVNQESLRRQSSHAADLWRPEDFTALVNNLKVAAALKKQAWTEWPVDRKDPRRLWLK